MKLLRKKQQPQLTMADAIAQLEALAIQTFTADTPQGPLVAYILKDGEGQIHEVKYLVRTKDFQSAYEELYCSTCQEFLGRSLWNCWIGFVSEGYLSPSLADHLWPKRGTTERRAQLWMNKS